MSAKERQGLGVRSTPAQTEPPSSETPASAAVWVDDFFALVGHYEQFPDDELLGMSDVIVGPLYVAVEPRETMEQPRTESGRFSVTQPRIAVKSGPFTMFTVGDYYDGGYDGLAARLELVCRFVNRALEAGVSTDAVGRQPAGVPPYVSESGNVAGGSTA